MLELFIKDNNNSFCSWNGRRGSFSFLSAIEESIQGADLLHRKARKIIKDGWHNVRPLKSYGKISRQSNGLQPLYYIKDRSSGIRAPFFQYEKSVFIGIFVFFKKGTDQESLMFKKAEESQEDIIKWIKENEKFYKKLIS